MVSRDGQAAGIAWDVQVIFSRPLPRRPAIRQRMRRIVWQNVVRMITLTPLASYVPPSAFRTRRSLAFIRAAPETVLIRNLRPPAAAPAGSRTGQRASDGPVS
jgi:hypothetical protein